MSSVARSAGLPMFFARRSWGSAPLPPQALCYRRAPRAKTKYPAKLNLAVHSDALLYSASLQKLFPTLVRKSMRLCNLMLLMLLPALPAFAQNTQVTVGKHASRIPKDCESVVPASIEGNVDIPALVKEAYCKGAGDMIADYSYVMNSRRRSKDKKGQTKRRVYHLRSFHSDFEERDARKRDTGGHRSRWRARAGGGPGKGADRGGRTSGKSGREERT